MFDPDKAAAISIGPVKANPEGTVKVVDATAAFPKITFDPVPETVQAVPIEVLAPL